MRLNLKEVPLNYLLSWITFTVLIPVDIDWDNISVVSFLRVRIISIMLGFPRSQVHQRVSLSIVVLNKNSMCFDYYALIEICPFAIYCRLSFLTTFISRIYSVVGVKWNTSTSTFPSIFVVFLSIGLWVNLISFIRGSL